MTNINYEISPQLNNSMLDELYYAAWPHHNTFDFQPVLRQSLLWIGAWAEDRLIGFVYVAWDGAQHAFLLEPTVHPDFRRQGIGVQLVKTAASETAKHNVEWLHVDYEPYLAEFYRQCGFHHTEAGLMRLTSS